jgi:hypothetical protein
MTDDEREFKKKLEERILRLEAVVYYLESKLREEFLTTFISTLLNDYKELIQNQCNQINRKLGLQYVDQDDVFQEAVEYLIRWCLPASMQKSTTSTVWLPYLKRSLNNVYVNLFKKANTASRKMDMVYLDDGEKGSAVLEKYGIDNAIDLTKELEYRELIRLVAGDLSDKSREIFLGLLNPTDEIIDFVITMRKNRGRRADDLRQLATYYKLSIHKFSRCLDEIKLSIKNNAEKV